MCRPSPVNERTLRPEAFRTAVADECACERAGRRACAGTLERVVSEQHPLVTIGLPVHNGENFLGEALDTLRAQTLDDFELVVSDNASTDRTAEIVEVAASEDPRIRYVRQATNIGAAANFNFVFTEARGKYFCWASHDDRWAPEFLARCVKALDADGEAVVAFAGRAEIDATGAHLGDVGLRPDVGSDRVHVRFRNVLLPTQDVHPIFGVMRTDVLRQTPLMRAHIGSDRALLAELALRGPFREVPEPLFFSRQHPERYTQGGFNRAQRLQWWSPGRTRRTVQLAHWTRLVDYASAIRRVSLTADERARCWGELLADARRRWRALAYDVMVAVRDTIPGLRARTRA